MSSKTIKVFAPATVSNVGPGFDIMGFALGYPGEEMILRLSDRKRISIKKIKGFNNGLPTDPEKNTAAVALAAMMKALDYSGGVEIEIKKLMNSGSGLGSSAASAVAAPFALNEILGKPFSKDELLDFALKGEQIASGGSIHADNVAPCLYGGFVLIRSYNPIDLIKIEAPKKLFCTVLHPQFEIKTSEARKMLKKNVPLKSTVTQCGNTAGLIAGLLRSDFDLIGRSLVDVIVEPVRAALIPGYNEIREAAFDTGAMNCNISGSGPAMFSFSRSQSDAEAIGRAMKKASANFTKENKVHVSLVNRKGPVVIG